MQHLKPSPPTTIFGFLFGIALITSIGTTLQGCGEESGGRANNLSRETDCNNVPGGTATIDGCGNCVGGSTGLSPCPSDCNGVVGGSATEDHCGTCDDDSTNDCQQDCSGEWGGTATMDDCGTCDDNAANDCQIEIPEGMVFVKGGNFTMGCNSFVDSDCDDDEKPYHDVFISGFFIDVTEVTAGNYKDCVDAGTCNYTGSTSNAAHTYNNSRDNHPINYVSWTDATTYCEAKEKRLPTEAEWEKAARGEDGRMYPWGNESATCNYTVMREGSIKGCDQGTTWPVGSKTAGASPYNAMDMAGNVAEWVGDWYDEGYYSVSPHNDPEGPSSSPFGYRVMRGGSLTSAAKMLRTSQRQIYDSTTQLSISGFRCAQSFGN